MPKRTLLTAATLVLALLVASVGVAASSQPDHVATRQALMDASAAAAGLSAAMLKNEMPYSRKAAKSAITTFWAVSLALGPHFAEKSIGDNTDASPKIWTDHANFEKQLNGYITDTTAALKASGKDGPADLAAFKTAVTPVLRHCKACHQDYKL